MTLCATSMPYAIHGLLRYSTWGTNKVIQGTVQSLGTDTNGYFF